MSYQHILFALDEHGIALVTVNRPEKLNALSGAVVLELKDAFERIAGDAAIRAAILTGAGEKAFVAGADISELALLSPYEARAYAARGQAVFRTLETCGKPTVAAVNGFALGGGLELAMACAVRFASENARLGQPEVKLGIIPGYGGTQRLPRLVGRGRALELLLAGEPVTAAEAHRIGLVNAVVPQPELLDYSRAWLPKCWPTGRWRWAWCSKPWTWASIPASMPACGSKPPPLESARQPKIVARARARFSRRDARPLRESEICRE